MVSAKHQTSEYRRNARIIRQRVEAAHRRGQAVPCWRCGGAILPGQAYDVGHRPGAQRSRLHELAPEHRHRTGTCTGNRADGGKLGAARTNAGRSARTVPTTTATRWPI